MAGLNARQGAAHGSPRSPAATTSEQELNINQLISQYADPKPPSADAKVRDNKQLSLPIQRPVSNPKSSAKSQVASLGSPKVTKPHNGQMAGSDAQKFSIQHFSTGSLSDGEIYEEQKGLPSTEPKETQITKAINTDRAALHEPQDESSKNGGPRESSKGLILPSHPKPQASRTDRRDETDPRQDRKSHLSNHTNKRRPQPSDSETSQRRDFNEDFHRSEIKSLMREDTTRPQREAKVPTLEELLPLNEDLREWLEITGYHNEPYRSKILHRRRAIAALEAQKNALLAEMEAEERGGIPPVVSGVSTIYGTILPPPIHNQAGDQTEPSHNPTILPPESQRDSFISNKRSHSDVQDARAENVAKVARTNDRGVRVKQDESSEMFSRGRSSGYDPSRRHSFDDRRDDRPDDRSSPRTRCEESRGRGRGSSRERELSLGRKVFESRLPPRSTFYDDDYALRDRDDCEDRDGPERRPFVVRGGYRGRAFDPHYRSKTRRGRGGRGRGDHQSHAEPRSDPGAFDAKIANGKPYKDPRSFDRGGKGGQ